MGDRTPGASLKKIRKLHSARRDQVRDRRGFGVQVDGVQNDAYQGETVDPSSIRLRDMPAGETRYPADEDSNRGNEEGVNRRAWSAGPSDGGVSTSGKMQEQQGDVSGARYGNNSSLAPADRQGDLRGGDPDLQTEDEKTYALIEREFRKLAGPGERLNKETFKKALQVKESFFADRCFELFDDDHSGDIDLEEVLQGLRSLTQGTPEEKLHFLFRIYDADNSGSISREELGTVLRSCMAESSLELSEDNLQALTDALFDDADTDRSGSITFAELKAQLDKHPGIMENLTVSAANWLMPQKKKKKPVCTFPRHLTLTYIRNNLVKVVFTLVYLMLNIGLYALNCWLYRDSNWYIIVARGAGMCLNLNCSLALVLMLRRSLTFLRNTPLVKVLPFDQHVMFHKMAGYAVVLFTLVHTGAHLGNAIVYLTDSTGLSLVEILFTLEAGVGWVAGFAPLSGVILDVILLVMFVGSMDFVRKSGYFQAFYWTHKLYVPFYVLNIVHGANFWKWLVGPALIFIVELLVRLQWMRKGSMKIESVCLLPSGVTQLNISRPQGFAFKSGDYIFLNIPAIAKYEWHPFTISSAPEMQDIFTVHIRSAGHWTRLVYSYFTVLGDHQSDPEAGLTADKARRKTLYNLRDSFSHRRRNTKQSVPQLTSMPHQAKVLNEGRKSRVKTFDVAIDVAVDGPYGTATRHIFEAEHAVLIGSGIGVTPFASVLQSIIHRFKAAEVTCPQCSHCFCADMPSNMMRLKKVDFVWINRDQRNFEWFLSLLSKLEREQARSASVGRSLTLHMFMTAALGKKDMKGVGLQMALDLIHQNEKTDLITGLQTRTQPGRPDFDKLFGEIGATSPSHTKVKVFFCGAATLGQSIKQACLKHGFGFSQEHF